MYVEQIGDTSISSTVGRFLRISSQIVDHSAAWACVAPDRTNVTISLIHMREGFGRHGIQQHSTARSRFVWLALVASEVLPSRMF